MATITTTINHSFSKINEKVKISSIPFRSWEDFSNIVSNTTGETGTRFLEYKIRYSRDAIKFTQWGSFTNFVNAINSVPLFLFEKNDFIVEIEAIRKGTDDSGVIDWNNVVFTGNINSNYLTLDNILQGTIFEEIPWTDEEWNYTWMNLLRKLFFRGIVPNFIERNKDVNIDDSDYINFWKTIAYFYAYIIILGEKRIGGIYEDRFLLREYLRQKDVFVCESESLINMQQIVSELFVNFRQRGTEMIKVEKDVSVNQDFNGELRRILCWSLNECDEFVYEFLPMNLSGIVVDQSSPTSLSTLNHHQLDKSPEITRDFVDLTKYTTTTKCSIVSDTFVDGTAIEVLNVKHSGGVFEIGGTVAPVFEDCIIVNEDLDYVLSFYYKQLAANANCLSFDLATFDCDDNVVNLLDAEFGIPSANIFNLLEVSQINVWNHIKIMIYNKNAVISGSYAFESLGVGRHKKFSTGAKRLAVRIVNSLGVNPTDFRIADFKFQPAYLPKNNAWINPQRIAVLYGENKNSELSDIRLQDEIERSLLPYGTRLLYKSL